MGEISLPQAPPPLPRLATGLTSLYLSYGLLLALPLAIVHTGWIVAVAEVLPRLLLLATTPRCSRAPSEAWPPVSS